MTIREWHNANHPRPMILCQLCAEISAYLADLMNDTDQSSATIVAHKQVSNNSGDAQPAEDS